jgi:hypothetical protein
MRSAWKSWYLLPVVFLLLLGALCPMVASAEVGVSVNINLGPPPVVVAEPPEVVMVPQSRVYFVPESRVDIFFYSGYWWSPRGDHWYRSRNYNHGWVSVAPVHVPRAVIYMPRDYRVRYAHAQRHPYGQWKHEYAKWDKEQGKAHRHWEKEREKEWKHQAKQDRYDRNGYRHGGNHRDDRHDNRPDNRHDDGRNNGRSGHDDGRNGHGGGNDRYEKR